MGRGPCKGAKNVNMQYIKLNNKKIKKSPSSYFDLPKYLSTYILKIS